MDTKFLKNLTSTVFRVGFYSKIILLIGVLATSSCAEEPETKDLRNSPVPKNINSADGTLQDERMESIASSPKETDQDETADSLVDQGDTNDAADVVITPSEKPAIISQLTADQTELVGKNIVIEGTADGDGTLTYTWLKNNEAIDLATNENIRIDKNRLEITSAKMDQSGDYTLTVGNEFGKDSKRSKLTINPDTNYKGPDFECANGVCGAMESIGWVVEGGQNRFRFKGWICTVGEPIKSLALARLQRQEGGSILAQTYSIDTEIERYDIAQNCGLVQGTPIEGGFSVFLSDDQMKDYYNNPTSVMWVQADAKLQKGMFPFGVIGLKSYQQGSVPKPPN